MSTRDELAKVVDAHELQYDTTGRSTYCRCGWDGPYREHSQHVADAILAAGYVKADREEWGVILDDYGSTDMFDSEAEAREDQKRNGGTVARFTVTEYPQEVA